MSVYQEKLQRIYAGGTPRVLDLFAGAGGLSLGFKTAGFQIIGAVEKDPKAAMTHAMNFFGWRPDHEPNAHSEARDITSVDPKRLLQELGYDNPEQTVDVIIGGPPCQAYARVGRAKLREVEAHPEAYLQDARGNLYLRFLDYVKQLKPLIVLMENVPDALNYGGHNIGEETCEVLSEIGYQCAYTLLNSAFYGVPQIRERMFILAYAREIQSDIQFPNPTHWIDLPVGYQLARKTALKSVNGNGQKPLFPSENEQLPMYYIENQTPSEDLPSAVSVSEALGDLPPIYALELHHRGELKRGARDLGEQHSYVLNEPGQYALLMRNWPGFENDVTVSAHVIRYLPRDYRTFRDMRPGDEYPQALEVAKQIFYEELQQHSNGTQLAESSPEYQDLWSQIVPPYKADKFPNKWWKLKPDQLMLL